jgi:hypothetical protein
VHRCDELVAILRHCQAATATAHGGREAALLEVQQAASSSKQQAVRRKTQTQIQGPGKYRVPRIAYHHGQRAAGAAGSTHHRMPYRYRRTSTSALSIAIGTTSTLAPARNQRRGPGGGRPLEQRQKPNEIPNPETTHAPGSVGQGQGGPFKKNDGSVVHLPQLRKKVVT